MAAPDPTPEVPPTVPPVAAPTVPPAASITSVPLAEVPTVAPVAPVALVLSPVTLLDRLKSSWPHAVLWIASYVATACIALIAAYLGLPAPPPVLITKTVMVASEVAPNVPPGSHVTEGYSPTFGWVTPDAETIAANLDPVKTMQFDSTPAGKAALGDADVYLWQAVRKVNNKGPPWYPNVNQLNVGCCVGCGWKHCTDVGQATQILAGNRATWLPTSVEVIYGESRVDVGGNRISGDGSVGAWAAKAAANYGVAAMQKYGDTDLSEFSPARARQYGQYGVPAEVKSAAHEHLIKGTALVKTWADVKRAIGQGYPVAVCSNQGFTMERDRDGFARAQGTWGHCMSIIGVRSQPREGGFILNSWGDQAHTGSVYPSDMPVAGFWADAATIERMVSQNDSFALADIAGFPARRPDWFINLINLNVPPHGFAAMPETAVIYNPKHYAPFGNSIYELKSEFALAP